MSSAINDAISQARAANAEISQTAQTNLPSAETVSQQATQVAVGGAPRSLTDFLDNAGMSVDCYLGVDKGGITFGKDTRQHDSVLVKFTIDQGKPGFTLRVNTGSGVMYHTSWDGMTEARSRENWQKLAADAKKIDKNSYVSDLFELPCELMEDYDRKDGGPIKAGTIVGLSLGYQRVKVFQAFAKKIAAEKRLGEELTVRLVQQTRVGGGQQYGVFTFEEVV